MRGQPPPTLFLNVSDNQTLKSNFFTLNILSAEPNSILGSSVSNKPKLAPEAGGWHSFMKEKHTHRLEMINNGMPIDRRRLTVHFVLRLSSSVTHSAAFVLRSLLMLQYSTNAHRSIAYFPFQHIPADAQDARLELITACQHKILALCVSSCCEKKRRFIYLFYELKAL